MSRTLVAAALLALPAPPLAAKGYTKNVAIVIYDGVEVLDFAGPAEVFAAASRRGAQGEERAFHVYTVSKGRDPIVSQGFIDVIPDHTIADCPPPDIIVLPGGGSDAVIADAAWLSWVRRAGADADHVLTVCTGAFIAAKLGWLDGLDVTTWYAAVDDLAREYPKARVHPGRRFIDNGKVVTTAGVSAGIDGALHLVARTLGRYVADRTAEYMEYAWSPQAYLSSAYPLLNPRLDARGRRLQEATIAQATKDDDAALAIYRELTTKDQADADAWLGIGRLMHARGRYAEAAEAFTEAAKGSAPATALYNLACALARDGKKDEAIQAVQRAIEAGLKDRSLYRGDPDLRSLQSDERFVRLIESP